MLGSESIAYRRFPAARSLRTDLIAELKERQIPLLVYTVNDHGAESLAEHLARIGVDGLFTDDPIGLGCALRGNRQPVRVVLDRCGPLAAAMSRRPAVDWTRPLAADRSRAVNPVRPKSR